MFLPQSPSVLAQNIKGELSKQVPGLVWKDPNQVAFYAGREETLSINKRSGEVGSSRTLRVLSHPTTSKESSQGLILLLVTGLNQNVPQQLTLITASSSQILLIQVPMKMIRQNKVREIRFKGCVIPCISSPLYLTREKVQMFLITGHSDVPSPIHRGSQYSNDRRSCVVGLDLYYVGELRWLSRRRRRRGGGGGRERGGGREGGREGESK